MQASTSLKLLEPLTPMADDDEFTTKTREETPANILIKVESFSLLSKSGIGMYESRDFVAGDYRWRLIIYPDGLDYENQNDNISVYLSMVGTSSLPVDWEVNAVFSFFVYNHNLDNYLCFQGKVRRFHAMRYKWGFSKLISKKIFTDPSNGYLVDDNCVFGAEVSVKKNRVYEFLYVPKTRDPVKHDWVISRFSELSDVWTSEEFLAGGHQWKIKLYPNGNGSGKGRSVSIYLESIDSKSLAPHEKVKADFSIRIKAQTYNEFTQTGSSSHWFTCSEHEGGLPDFIPIAHMHEQWRGLLKHDNCYLELVITVQAIVRNAPRSE